MGTKTNQTAMAAMDQLMAVKSFTVIEDCGDGTSTIRYFSSKEAAEDFIDEDNYEDCGGPIPDEVFTEEFTIGEGGVLKPKYGFDDREDFDG